MLSQSEIVFPGNNSPSFGPIFLPTTCFGAFQRNPINSPLHSLRLHVPSSQTSSLPYPPSSKANLDGEVAVQFADEIALGTVINDDHNFFGVLNPSCRLLNYNMYIANLLNLL